MNPSNGRAMQSFKDAWLKKPAYDLGNAKLVHILGRLSETYLTGKVEPLSFEQQPSIEHTSCRRPGLRIGPCRTVQKEWTVARELGEVAEDGDPRPFATEMRDQSLADHGQPDDTDAAAQYGAIEQRVEKQKTRPDEVLSPPDQSGSA